MSSAPRRPRRAVRPPGTVGRDESVLRTALPAVPSGQAAAPAAPGGRGVTPPDDAVTGATPRSGDTADPWTAVRSADDSDRGWGHEEPSSNDERLRREKPPHW